VIGEGAAAGVVDGGGVGQLQAGGVLDQHGAGVGDDLGAQHVGRAGDVHLPTVGQRLAVQRIAAGEIQFAAGLDRYGTTGDAALPAGAGIRTKDDLGARLEDDTTTGNAVRVCYPDLDVQRAALEVDRSGIGEAREPLDITALPQIDRAGIGDDALIDRRHRLVASSSSSSLVPTLTVPKFLRIESALMSNVVPIVSDAPD